MRVGVARAEPDRVVQDVHLQFRHPGLVVAVGQPEPRFDFAGLDGGLEGLEGRRVGWTVLRHLHVPPLHRRRAVKRALTRQAGRGGGVS